MRTALVWHMLMLMTLGITLEGCNSPGGPVSARPSSDRISAVRVYRSNLSPSLETRTLTYIGDLPPQGVEYMRGYLEGLRKRFGGGYAYVFCQYYVDVVGEDASVVRLGIVWDEAADAYQRYIDADCTRPDPAKVPSGAIRTLYRNHNIELGRKLLEVIRELDSIGNGA